MKKLSLTLLFLLIGIHTPTPVLASFSDWIYPVTTGTINQWSNPLDVADSNDGTYATINNAQNANHEQAYKFNVPFITTQDTINSVEVYVKYKTSNVTGGELLGVKMFDNEAQAAINRTTPPYSGDVNGWADTGWQEHTFVYSNDPPNNLVSDYFETNGGFNHAQFSINPFFSTGTTMKNYQVAELRIRINWEEYGATITDVTLTASPSAQLVLMDVSGDTATSSAAMSCQVKIFESCVGENVAGFTTEEPVASILLEEPDEGVTRKLSPWYFKGYGWSANDSTWQASKVELPYHQGMTCEYDLHTVCTERVRTCSNDNPPICVWTDDIIHEDKHHDSNASILHTGFTEPEPDNPLAWVVWKMKQTLYEFFTPNWQYILTEWRNFDQTMRTHVPFAYIYQVASVIGTVTSVERPDNFEINFPVFEMDGTKDRYVEVTLPPVMDQVIVYLRWFIKAMMYLYFAHYVANAWKKIIPIGG